MESINALLIQQGLPQNDRLTQLYKVAMRQMKSLLDNKIANFSNLEYSSFLGGGRIDPVYEFFNGLLSIFNFT